MFILFTPGKNEHEYILFMNNEITYNDYCAISDDFTASPILSAFTGLLFSLAKRRKGVYVIPKKANLYQIFKSIFRNKQYLLKINIRAGYTVEQIMHQLDKTVGLIDKSTVILKEGELLSSTYYYTYGTKRDVLIIKMKKALENLKSKLWKKYAYRTRVKNIDQAVILASIVVREAEIKEYDQVANVFLNRLEKGMRLQACSTIIYILQKMGIKRDKLFYNDLHIVSKMNTYRNDGLPPIPIGLVNMQALEAVLRSYKLNNNLFFVKNSTFGHVFNKEYNSHLKIQKTSKRKRVKY